MWNGVCGSELCLEQGTHCRFQCGSVVDVGGEGPAIGTRRRVGDAVMVGTCLAFWGGLVVAASVLG